MIEMTWSAGRPARLAASAPSRSDSGTIRTITIAARISEFVSLPLIWFQIGDLGARA